jgi:hypothetical protein
LTPEQRDAFCADLDALAEKHAAAIATGDGTMCDILSGIAAVIDGYERGDIALPENRIYSDIIDDVVDGIRHASMSLYCSTK